MGRRQRVKAMKRALAFKGLKVQTFLGEFLEVFEVARKT